MKRIGILAGAAMTMGLLLAGNAQAGYVLATYDLAGSTLTTTTLLGSDVDQITGSVTFRYWGATSTLSPLTGNSASLVGGDTYTLIDQNFGGNIVLNGYNDQTVGGQNLALPPGAAIMLGGAAATQVNQLHCTGGLCAAGGFVPSVTQTNNTNNPFFMPTILFTTGLAGHGDWAAGTLTLTQGTGLSSVSLQFNYVGQEISRSFIPEPGTASLVYLGLAGIAGASSFRRRRRNR